MSFLVNRSVVARNLQCSEKRWRPKSRITESPTRRFHTRRFFSSSKMCLWSQVRLGRRTVRVGVNENHKGRGSKKHGQEPWAGVKREWQYWPANSAMTYEYETTTQSGWAVQTTLRLCHAMMQVDEGKQWVLLLDQERLHWSGLHQFRWISAKMVMNASNQENSEFCVKGGLK